MMPAGWDVIAPLPEVDTVSTTVVETNVAVTDLAAPMDTEQAPEPEQPPPQALKTQPEAGAGLRVTEDPLG